MSTVVEEIEYYKTLITEHRNRIASIEDYGFMDVYNMQVRDTNNFVGNGIVLHNCDSIRYALYTHALSNIERSDVSIGFM